MCVKISKIFSLVWIFRGVLCFVLINDSTWIGESASKNEAECSVRIGIGSERDDSGPNRSGGDFLKGIFLKIRFFAAGAEIRGVEGSKSGDGTETPEKISGGSGWRPVRRVAGGYINIYPATRKCRVGQRDIPIGGGSALARCGGSRSFIRRRTAVFSRTVGRRGGRRRSRDGCSVAEA